PGEGRSPPAPALALDRRRAGAGLVARGQRPPGLADAVGGEGQGWPVRRWLGAIDDVAEVEPGRGGQVGDGHHAVGEAGVHLRLGGGADRLLARGGEAGCPAGGRHGDGGGEVTAGIGGDGRARGQVRLRRRGRGRAYHSGQGAGLRDDQQGV